jgi:flagellar biosynthesis/type III secretory pathway M-ring protein FliF/YscJ
VAARRALTATRAKAIVVAFAFFIIAFNVVAVALRRREEAAIPALSEEAPSDVLDAAKETAESAEADTQAPPAQQSEQTPDGQA